MVKITPATIAKLDLGPDDAVVINSTVHLTAAQAADMKAAVRELLGADRKVLVCSPELSISVLERRRDGEAAQATRGEEES